MFLLPTVPNCFVIFVLSLISLLFVVPAAVASPSAAALCNRIVFVGVFWFLVV